MAAAKAMFVFSRCFTRFTLNDTIYFTQETCWLYAKCNSDLFRKHVNDMMLLHADDPEDEDLENLLVDALCHEASSVSFSFKINLESIDEQVCINLFR